MKTGLNVSDLEVSLTQLKAKRVRLLRDINILFQQQRQAEALRQSRKDVLLQQQEQEALRQRSKRRRSL